MIAIGEMEAGINADGAALLQAMKTEFIINE